MKIALYSGSIPSTTFIENLIVGLAEKNILYVFGKKKSIVSYTSKNIKIFSTPKNVIRFSLHIIFNSIFLFIRYPKRYFLLLNMLKDKNRLYALSYWSKYLPVMLHLPDIFHLQWVKEIEDWVFLKDLGVKLVVSFRGTHINVSPIVDKDLACMYKKVLPLYDAYHTVSNDILIKAEQYILSKNKSKIIYPAVNMDIVVSEETLLKYKKNKECLNILSVGRNNWIKGYDIALDACKLLKEKGINFRYKIVAGKNIEELIYQVYDLKLESFVDIIDNMPQCEVFELYKSSDLFLLPSVEEGIANVVLEAMALGCPVLSTECGGMKEVIKEGINGMIIPIRNPKVMADKIEEFISMSDNNIIDMLKEARNTILKNHIIDKQIDGIMGLYNNII